MRKAAVLVAMALPLLLGGCCSFTADKQAMVKASLTTLQSGYNTTVSYLDTPDAPQVDPKTKAAMKMAQGAATLAVPLIDGALDQLGKVLAAKCPAPEAVTKALADAQMAAKAQQEALIIAGQKGVMPPAVP